MTPFEYLSVLLSIILGLAITQVLQGYRGLMLARGQVRLYWPPLLWSGLVLLMATQAWWASFGLRDQQEWNFGTFLVILLQMGLIYMTAAVVLPDVAEGAPVDLKMHYEAQRRPFFGCLLAIVVVSLMKDLLLDGTLPSPTNIAFHTLFAGVAGAGFLVRNQSAQLAIAGLTAAMLVAYVALLFARL